MPNSACTPRTGVILALALLVAIGLLALFFTVMKPGSVQSPVARSDSPSQPIEDEGTLDALPERNPAAVVEATAAGKDAAQQPLVVSTNSIVIKVELINDAQQPIMEGNVEWNVLRGGEDREFKRVVVRDGTTLFVLPNGARELRVVGFAPNYLPCERILTGFGKQYAKRDPITGCNAVVRLELEPAKSHQTPIWGHIQMDGKDYIPDGLEVTATATGLGLDVGKLRNLPVLIDRNASTFHIRKDVGGEVRLTASSNESLPYTVAIQRTPNSPAVRHDLPLTSGNCLTLHVVDQRNAPVPELRVTLEYSQHTYTLANDIAGSRVFSRERRAGTTNEFGNVIFSGVVAGSLVDIECLKTSPAKVVAKCKRIMPELPTRQPITICVNDSGDVYTRLRGTAEYPSSDPQQPCRILMTAADRHYPLESGDYSGTSWELRTSYRGEVDIWAQCGQERVSRLVRHVITDRDEVPINLPALETTSLTVHWRNAPIGWRLRLLQENRRLVDELLNASEGKAEIRLESSLPVDCHITSGRGEFQLTSFSGSEFKADQSLDLGAVTPINIEIRFPSAAIKVPEIDGELLLQSLDLPSGVLSRRIKVAMTGGKAQLPFNIVGEPTYYRLLTVGKPLFVAGILTAAPDASELVVGDGHRWTTLGELRTGNARTLELVSVNGRSLTTLVPADLLRAELTSLIGSALLEPVNSAAPILIPGTGSTVLSK